MPGEGLSDRLVQGMVKFGGGFLMIWGCMSWEWPGNVTKFDGKMDADLFMSILDDELQESIEYYKKKPSDVLFQQDNDPKHKNKKAHKWLQDSGCELWCGPLNQQMYIPLNTFGITSKWGLQTVSGQS